MRPNTVRSQLGVSEPKEHKPCWQTKFLLLFMTSKGDRAIIPKAVTCTHRFVNFMLLSSLQLVKLTRLGFRSSSSARPCAPF